MMEFGRGILEREDLIDFYKFENTNWCSKDKFELYLGLPQWSESSWKEKLYPKSIPEKGFLEYYSKVFNCVEVSSTFYAPVKKETIEKWAGNTPGNFRFLPKWPKGITHGSFLKSNEKEIKLFVETLETFGERLGTSILQLPPSFSRKFTRELYHFLLKIPKEIPVAIEFRHASWFEGGRLYQKLENYFEKENIGSVSTDTPGRRNIFHLSMTGGHNVVRYLSDQVASNDETRLGRWQEYLKKRELGGSIYFALHRPDNENVMDLVSSIDYELSLKIAEGLKNDKKQLNLL